MNFIVQVYTESTCYISLVINRPSISLDDLLAPQRGTSDNVECRKCGGSLHSLFAALVMFPRGRQHSYPGNCAEQMISVRNTHDNTIEYVDKGARYAIIALNIFDFYQHKKIDYQVADLDEVKLAGQFVST